MLMARAPAISHFRLEIPIVLGFRHHQAAHVAVEQPANLVGLQVAALMRSRGHDLEAGQRATGGIRSHARCRE